MFNMRLWPPCLSPPVPCQSTALDSVYPVPEGKERGRGRGREREREGERGRGVSDSTCIWTAMPESFPASNIRRLS